MKKTCAITGHRSLKRDFSAARLKDMLTGIINDGFTNFYVGMARGFDILCCEQLLELKKNFKEIKIIACVPCLGQEKYYSFDEKLKYYNCLGKCDEVKILNEKYTTGCMQMRNRYMVDNSRALFAYIYRYAGGTFYTVNYAKDKNKQIIYYKE